MNVIATSIDHHKADITQREIFACSLDQAEKIYDLAEEDPAIKGAVLINTCNRTELYLSLREGSEGREEAVAHPESREEAVSGDPVAAPDPFDILCRALGLSKKDYEHLQTTMANDDALRHLCLLTAGAESQLWGDSQIITQVGDAVEFARNNGSTDSVLNTMFRLGITAGKEIRTHVDLYINDASTAGRAAQRVLMEPEIRSVLVIGNGAIGRLVAGNLAKAGITTYMTLRRYNNGQAIVPEDVEAVPYADRYRIMEKCDGVVSATSSPHVVVTRSKLEEAAALPRIFIDMAVPRDIEETVSEIEGVQCYNIDDISRGHHIKLKVDQLRQLDDYIEEQVREYHRWENSRRKVEDKIRRLTADDRDRSDRSHFPLFIDSTRLPVVVIGGGNIAERRVMTMAEFGFDITILSEDLTDTLDRMVKGGAVSWIRGRYSNESPADIDELIDGAWMILACTNDRDINRKVGRDCRKKNKLVNVCDARNESTFWFPAVALSDELTVGTVGRGTDHVNVKHAAAAIREVVEKKAYK